MNINQRFYEELFVKKNVTLHSEEYKKLYNSIWPGETFFKEFLLATNTNLKLDYAKKIFSYVQAFNKVFLPKGYIDKVISYQQRYLVESSEKYLPQDHIIHSINLYILGVYLFFNYSLFHTKILGEPNPKKSLTDRIQSFIEKWQSFAFYHDIGYYLEGNTSDDGSFSKDIFSSIEEYNTIYKKFLFFYVVRNTAKLICNISMIKKSDCSFNFDEVVGRDKSQWTENDGKKFSSSELSKELYNFNESTMLKYVNSQKSFDKLLPAITNSDYLVVIYNKQELPVKILIKRGNQTIKQYTKEETDQFCLNQEYLYRFFVKKPINKIEDRIEPCLKGFVSNFYNDLPNFLHQELDMVSNELQLDNYFYLINDWLLSKIDENIILTDKITFNKFIGKQYEKAAECYFKAVAEKYFQDKANKIGSINELTNLVKSFVKMLNNSQKHEDIIQEIVSLATENFVKENGVPHDILSFCQRTYIMLMEKFNSDDIHLLDFKKLNFIEINENKVELNLFNHDKETSEITFEKILYKKIRELSDRMDIDISSLCSYKTDHSNCDHGLISAGLLYQAVVFSNYITKGHRESKNPFLLWGEIIEQEKMDDEIFAETFADSIFSILLHNIYTKSSGAVYGIDYVQNVNNNSFSYFCSFCDTLQKWGRTKQLDQSKANLPPNHFLGESFDLEIDNDKIVLYCDYISAEYLRCKQKEEEEFLCGLKSILQIRG